MALTINTNVASLNAQRNLNTTQTQLAKSMERLSSGLRINRAGDDAAGLAISQNMQANIRSMNQAVRNANDGISLVQTAEGALNETSNILLRMRELGTQAANGTLSDSQRSNIQVEFKSLQDEIDRISNVTDFNGTKLLNGALSAGTGMNLQIGTGTTAANDIISVKVSKADTATLSISAGASSGTAANVSTEAGARSALTNIDNAISAVATARGSLGAVQNRLQSTINNLQVAVENTSAANARIVDVDVAAETANMTRAQILTQAGVSILSSANQTPQLALKLLG
ncbi:MAG TPA: flagellin [Geobacteraceae bacterium]|nr:flagellin [Geobacteraceae bacterium]